MDEEQVIHEPVEDMPPAEVPEAEAPVEAVEPVEGVVVE